MEGTDSNLPPNSGELTSHRNGGKFSTQTWNLPTRNASDDLVEVWESNLSSRSIIDNIATHAASSLIYELVICQIILETY